MNTATRRVGPIVARTASRNAARAPFKVSGTGSKPDAASRKAPAPRSRRAAASCAVSRVNTCVGVSGAPPTFGNTERTTTSSLACPSRLPNDRRHSRAHRCMTLVTPRPSSPLRQITLGLPSFTQRVMVCSGTPRLKYTGKAFCNANSGWRSCHATMSFTGLGANSYETRLQTSSRTDSANASRSAACAGTPVTNAPPPGLRDPGAYTQSYTRTDTLGCAYSVERNDATRSRSYGS
mmetsp:Transcript_11655/g.49843  ORF Transcript_11655/g.49843 Transcript_11655/m.49843 type:complete len:236 (+) Transcript_11655:2239-2946(+)